MVKHYKHHQKEVEVEVKPYTIEKKSFEDIWEAQKKVMYKQFPFSSMDKAILVEMVALGIYNRVWEDIKKQLTGE